MAAGEFSGRVGLVTGAGSGIGAGTAKRFAAAGATVALMDIDEIAGEVVLAEIVGAGGTARFFHCDVTDAVQVESTVDGIVGTFGRLDFAFNNAGITGPVCPTADVTIDGWKQVIDLDLSGVFYCMKYEIPHMIASGGGAIVNASSDAGLHSLPTIAPYVAAKHAVVGLTKSTAQEYAAYGVRVNCVCPGVTDTPMMELWYNGHPESRASATKSIPIGRGATVDEIASAVMWLCSDDASYAVGMIMALDGGLTLGPYLSF
jgi:NAD(P)-dependent dehydrogenase (short-subunit alcohol dehydrogenase family)